MRTTTIIALAALFCAPLAGCGGGDDGDGACGFDADCAQESACVVSLCRALCVSEDSCESQQACRVATRSDGSTVRVCAGPDEDLSRGSPPSPKRCSSDAACRQELSDDRAICGLAGLCLLPTA